MLLQLAACSPVGDYTERQIAPYGAFLHTVFVLIKFLQYIHVMRYSYFKAAGAARKDRGNKMEKKVKALLIKWGNNADDVEAMMSKWFDVIYKGNKDEPARYIANMVRTAW